MSAVEHLYVHVPFCPRVCPYCAFYVMPADRRRSGPLVDALLEELRYRLRAVELRPRTIYVPSPAGFVMFTFHVWLPSGPMNAPELDGANQLEPDHGTEQLAFADIDHV